MLRYSPCAGTSKTATVAVTTRGVPLLMETNNNIFQISSGTPRVFTATVATYRHRGCSATSQRAFKFLVANVTYKINTGFFTTKR